MRLTERALRPSDLKGPICYRPWVLVYQKSGHGITVEIWANEELAKDAMFRYFDRHSITIGSMETYSISTRNHSWKISRVETMRACATCHIYEGEILGDASGTT